MIGLNLKSARERAGLSQGQLAEILGTSINTISRWENGQFSPDDETKLKLAQILNTSASFLLGETNNMNPLEENDLDSKLGDCAKENPETIVSRFADVTDLSMWDIHNAATEILKKDDPKGYEEEFKNISDNFISVPVVEPIACAGTGNAYVEIQFDVIEERYINKNEIIGHSWHNDGFKIIKIEGDSMEPRFFTGDMVLLSEEEARSGDIIVACWDYRFYLRGFFVEDSTIKLRAINKKYQDIQIDLEDERFSIVGKVIAVVPPLKKIGGYW